jgi:hypothetical protein
MVKFCQFRDVFKQDDIFIPYAFHDVESPLAERLTNGVKEDKHHVTELRQPQYCFIHIKGIAENTKNARSFHHNEQIN